MSGDTSYTVSVYIRTTDPAHVARAAEALGRAVAGLALEGIDASLHCSPDDPDEAAL